MLDERASDWIPAYIGVGSNLDDREGYLKEAVRMLDEHALIRVKACSSVYETEPVGYLDQPSFLNMAVCAETRLAPEQLLDYMLDVERRLHRKRDIRWGPRTIDLDLLLYGDQFIDTTELTVPHPRMLERAFVLIPLKEIYPGDALPHAPSISACLDTLEGKEGVKRWTNSL